MLLVKKDVTEYVEDIDGVDLQLKMDDTAYFVDALITNLYSNPEVSFIRELTSNAYDASVSVDPDAPIEIFIYFDNEIGEDVFEIRDYGYSMSETQMYKIYNTLGESTSRGDVRKIGAFGIGSKSPLAYTDFFFIITRHPDDNLRITWLFSKFKDALPKLSKLSSTPMDDGEKYGTTIKVPLEKHCQINEFKESVLKTTAYFPNVVYNFETASHTKEVLNDYAIVEFENSYLRIFNEKMEEFYEFLQEPHIVCNNVWYEIDTDNVLIKIVQKGMALKGNLNNISLIRSREALQYSKNTVEEIYKVNRKSNLDFYNKVLKPNRVTNCKTVDEYNAHKADLIKISIDGKIGFVVAIENRIHKTFRGISMNLYGTLGLDTFFDVSGYYDNVKQSTWYSSVNAMYYKKLSDKVSNKIVNNVHIVRLHKNIHSRLKMAELNLKDFLVIKEYLLEKKEVQPFCNLPDKIKKPKAESFSNLVNTCNEKHKVQHTSKIFYVKMPDNIRIYNKALYRVFGDKYWNIYRYQRNIPKNFPESKELVFDLEKVHLLVMIEKLIGRYKIDRYYYGMTSIEAYLYVDFEAKYNGVYVGYDVKSKFDSSNKYFNDFQDFKNSLEFLIKAFQEFSIYRNTVEEVVKDFRDTDLMLKVFKVVLINLGKFDKKKIDKLLIFSKKFIVHYKNVRKWLD